MAKRLGQIDKIGPAKKIKLDISINRGPIRNPSNIGEFWASDDDDDVLLATQKAEEKQREADGTSNTQLEYSFNEFAAQAQATTSTQQIIENDMLRINLPTSLTVEEIFGTDETFVFLPDTGNDQKTVYEEVETGSTSKCTDSSLILEKETRRQLAQERQLNFLMERVDVLKKENAKLQKNLIESNNQASTKDGEVCLLRNELRQARKLLQASKMDKLTMAEEGKRDCDEKVAKVYKQIEAKYTKLNFTNVELKELKVRNAKANGRYIYKENLELRVTDSDECRSLLRIENLCIDDPFSKLSCSNAKGYMYEFSRDECCQKKPRTFFEVELEQLLLDYGQLQSEPENVEAIKNRIFFSVSRVFIEFWSYTQSLDLPQNCMLYPNQYFDLNSDQCTYMRSSLIQPGALYNMERAILLRRYIGTLTLICQKESIISETLLTKKYRNYSLTKILIDAITNLSYSFEVVEHFGVIEAITSFLHSLLNHINAEKELTSECQNDLLFDLLKQLVFTRPSPWVFKELSACMLLCTQKRKLMSKMCVNCPSNCFVSDRVRSLYRFGHKSCLLQVYAGLIELCFSSDLPVQNGHFKLLLSICENHVRFVYQCFTSIPEFIMRMLSFPSFTDDETEDNEDRFSKVVGLNSDGTLSNNSDVNFHPSTLNGSNMSKVSLISVPEKVSQEIRCECYVKLCLSVVTIVYQMMYQWMMQIKKSDIAHVGRISQISVQLFTLIFREYYLTCIFRDSEETTKHYLSLLCNWWQTHARVLNFDDVHLRFLRQLQDLQFMLKPLHQEANPTYINDDLTEWTRLVINADANIHKYVQTEIPLKPETLFSKRTCDFFHGLQKIAYKFE